MGSSCSTDKDQRGSCCVADAETMPGADSELGGSGAQAHRIVNTEPPLPADQGPNDNDEMANTTLQTLSYNDGSTYEGQVDQSGKRHGVGRWTADVGSYEGQWRDDVQHGEGHQEWADGRVYDGQFTHGRFSGSGKMVWHTQAGDLSYEGQYHNDLKHGVGKFMWPDGRAYEGEWQNGQRHGRGTYTTSTGEKRGCFWEQDKFMAWEQDDGVKGTSDKKELTYSSAH